MAAMGCERLVVQLFTSQFVCKIFTKLLLHSNRPNHLVDVHFTH